MKTPYRRTCAVGLSALLTTSQASALIVLSKTVGTGISPPTTDGSRFWDVDGDTVSDFRLGNTDSSEKAVFDDETGDPRLVVRNAAGTDGIALLATSFQIGATLASGYKFHNGRQVANSITILGDIGVEASRSGWEQGVPGYFGFRFSIGGSLHYGWGRMEITGVESAPYGSGFVITEAWYEDEADTPIAVGAVPEPETAALGLAGLALGAAGLRRWRKRQAARTPRPQ